MPEVQKVIAETLRMWPAPPLLIRCEVQQRPSAVHLPCCRIVRPRRFHLVAEEAEMT